MLSTSILGLVFVLATVPQMPQGMSHDEHLKRSGAAAMGFDQDATVHHFLISDDGGAVQVTAKRKTDTATIAAVRAHLREIEKAFAAGDFQKPFMTHGEVAPGVPVMQERRAAISYRYEEIPDGGRVRISTTDPDARAAIREFLRYQISEHKTGDPVGR